MTDLIVPVTAILLRSAYSVLLLRGAEAHLSDRLDAKSRRGLWLFALLLMPFPQLGRAGTLLSFDLTIYRDFVVRLADLLPRALAAWFGDTAVSRLAAAASEHIPGVSPHSLPYFLLLAGAVGCSAALISASYLHFRKMIRRFHPVDDARILGVWERLAGRSRRPVLLDSGNDRQVPMLFGCLRQKLVLPQDALRQLDDRQLELLLTHELCHYRAGDGVVNLLSLCLWPFCWYNLFFPAARRRLRFSCELACDDAVLQRHPDCVSEYGNLLLYFSSTSGQVPGAALPFGDYADELHRRIVHLTTRRRGSRLWAWLLALFLALPFFMVSAYAQPDQPAQNPPLSVDHQCVAAGLSGSAQKN